MADRVRPFRGTSPFGDSDFDRAFFAGRDAEIDQLTAEVLASPSSLTVLFGRSGLGKTSLINAGVVGRLRERRRFPVVTRLTPPETSEALRSDIKHALLEGNIAESLISQVRTAASHRGIIITQASADEVGVASIKYSQDLWSFFAFSRFTLGHKPLRPVLIIDQFEELFSRFTPQARNAFIEQFSNFVRNRAPEALRRDAERQLNATERESLAEGAEFSILNDGGDYAFAQEIDVKTNPLGATNKHEKLAQLVYGDFGHDAKVVIVIREDFLYQLERLKEAIPNIFGTTFRLLPLRSEQARDAIELPPSRVAKFGGKPFSFDADAIDEILEFLQVEFADEGEVVEGAIEPLQLQILCADLDERRAREKKSNISKSDLGGRKGMQRIISSYYNRVIRTLPWIRVGWNGRRGWPSLSNLIVANFPRAAVRYLCEMQLITPQGRRRNLPGSLIEPKFGVEARDLRQLVNAYLLRSEPRLRDLHYELSHDSLVGTLLDHRWRGQLTRGAIRVWLATSFTALLLTYIAVASPFSETVYDTYVGKWKPGYVDQVNSPSTEAKTRSEAIRWLSRRGTTYFELTNLDLNGMDLSGVDATQSRLTNAKLRNVHFDAAALGNASFRKAIITNSHFNSARLRDANFTRATIYKTDFSDADLTRVSFKNSSLQDLDFSRAELHYASFSGAKFREDPKLEGSSWWTASGWNVNKIEEFRQSFPLKAYQESGFFEAGLREREDAIQRAARAPIDNNVLASSLNELAWWCATSGVWLCATPGFKLETAEEQARHALDLRANIKDHLSSTILDTLAYILMQKATQEDDPQKKRLREAYEKIRRAILEAMGDEDNDEDGQGQGERYFRYAWVLKKLDKSTEAQEMIEAAIDDKKYAPSHELVLLPGMLEQYREFVTPVVAGTELVKSDLNLPEALRVMGRNFRPDCCTATINGKPRPVRRLNKTELLVTLLAEDVVAPDEIQLIVANPGVTGASSDLTMIDVRAP
jgi:hypothetical protein